MTRDEYHRTCIEYYLLFVIFVSLSILFRLWPTFLFSFRPCACPPPNFQAPTSFLFHSLSLHLARFSKRKRQTKHPQIIILLISQQFSRTNMPLPEPCRNNNTFLSSSRQTTIVLFSLSFTLRESTNSRRIREISMHRASSPPSLLVTLIPHGFLAFPLPLLPLTNET